MKKASERRKDTRFPWEGTVTYRRSIPSRGSKLKEITGQGRLQNVSPHGLCLVTQQPLAPQQFLTVTVPLLIHPDLAIPTLAYVQWTRPARGTAHYIAGLSFLI